MISSSPDEFHVVVPCDFSSLEFRLDADSNLSLSRTFQVGIPFGGRVELAAATGLRPQDVSDSLLAQLEPERPSLVDVSPPLTVRRRQIVSVRVYPIRAGKLHTEVEVRLAIVGGERAGAVSVDDGFDRIFRSTVANADVFVDLPSGAPEVSQLRQADSGPLAASGQWFKVFVSQTGLCRLDASQLAAAGLNVGAGVPFDSVHLLSGGGLHVPMSNLDPRPTLEKVAYIRGDDGDGLFEDTEYLLFYAQGLNRWVYDQADTARYASHPYASSNVYWVAVTGDLAAPSATMTEQDATPGAYDTLVTSYRTYRRLEQDNLLRKYNNGGVDDYFTWYWSDQESLSLVAEAVGHVPGTIADIELAGVTYDTTAFNDDLGYIELSVNDSAGINRSCNNRRCTYQTTDLNDGLNTFGLVLTGSSSVRPYFDYLNLGFTSYLLPRGGQIDLALSGSGQVARVDVIDDFDSEVLLLDITDPLQPVHLTGFQRDGGFVRFSTTLTSAVPNRYFVAELDRVQVPESIELATPTDLYAIPGQVDLIVITDPAFIPTLDDWVNAKRGTGTSVEVVTVDNIMDNFAFGVYDPTAIRDYLKYAYETYPTPSPSTVLLVGDGTYDFLDRLETGVGNIVPPFVTDADESVSDDNYVYFGLYGLLDSDTSYVPGSNRGYDMMIARWPTKSVGELEMILQKLDWYDSPENNGPWRSNVTLVADDEEGGVSSTEVVHVRQTEELEKYYLPRVYDRNKIYLWEYPRVGPDKPGVNDDIVQAINDGTLLVNYVGHGNPDVWAHEHVFSRVSDLPRLQNTPQYPVFYNASCAIGFFDDPQREGMAEDLLVMPGGAVAVISASRLVYSQQNSDFNKKVFEIVFENPDVSLCEAVFAAKLERQYFDPVNPRPVANDRAYLVFADPYLKLGVPRYGIEFTQVPDSLVALGQTVVAGRVVDSLGQTVVADGELEIRVFDTDRKKTFLNEPYTLPGPSVFRGSASIDDGYFEFEFIVPLDIGYGGTGARVLTYADLGTSDGIGLVDSMSVASTVVAATDSVGPTIELNVVGRDGFVDGDLLGRDDQIQITLSDPSGINLTGGLGHGIGLQIDNRPDQTIQLTDSFEYDLDDFTRGSLLFSLSDLSVGRHEFKIKAWDNANNSSVLVFSAEVLAGGQFAIRDLLNYPNPMQDSTRISMSFTGATSQVRVEVFTLSGRRIWIYESNRSLPPGYFDGIVWDGRDMASDRVASGVYIYKATAVSVTGSDQAESYGKVVVLN